MKRVITVFSIFVLAASSPALAGQKGIWDNVRSLESREAAVKTRSGPLLFGIVREVRDDGLSIEVFNKRGTTGSTRALARAEVTGVWRAELRYGGRNTGKGALLGMGAGAAVGTAIFAGTVRNDDDGLSGAIIPLTMIYGAGIGALLGFFSKKSHKRLDKVYST